MSVSHLLSRGGLDNLLKTLPTTHHQQPQNIEITRIIFCSTNPEHFKGLSNFFQKEKIVTELNYYRDYCFPDLPPYKKSNDRPTLIKAFCEWRKLYFELNPEEY